MLTVTADGSTPSASSPSVSGLAAISLQSPGGRDRGGILRGGTVEADAALPVLFNDLTTGAVPCAASECLINRGLGRMP